MPLVKRRRRKRKKKPKQKITNEIILELLKLLTEKHKKKRKRRRKRKEPTSTDPAKGNPPQPESSAYSLAVAKEKQAAEFQAAQAALDVKEKNLLAVAQKAQALAIENGGSGNGQMLTANQIIAFKKAEGVTISMEKANEIIAKMQSDQRQIQTLSDDVLASQKELEKLQKQIEKGKMDAAAVEQRNKVLDAENKKFVEARRKLIYDEWYRGVRAEKTKELAKQNGESGYTAFTKPDLVKAFQNHDWFKKEFGEPNYDEEPSNPAPIAPPPSTARNEGTSSRIQNPPQTTSTPKPDDPTDNPADAFSLMLGAGLTQTENPLSDQDINTIMNEHGKYVGTYAADEMDEIPVSISFGFIINTEPRSVSNGHWTAVYIDNDTAKAVEYFDPFGEDPNEAFMKGLKKLVKKLDSEEYLKLKINRIKTQDVSSNTCGWHAMKFLIDRFKGKEFREVTGFDDSVKGEKDVKKLKNKYKTFGYI